MCYGKREKETIGQQKCKEQQTMWQQKCKEQQTMWQQKCKEQQHTVGANKGQSTTNNVTKKGKVLQKMWQKRAKCWEKSENKMTKYC